MTPRARVRSKAFYEDEKRDGGVAPPPTDDRRPTTDDRRRLRARLRVPMRRREIALSVASVECVEIDHCFFVSSLAYRHVDVAG